MAFVFHVTLFMLPLVNFQLETPFDYYSIIYDTIAQISAYLQIGNNLL
jgi:hypothetical protein